MKTLHLIRHAKSSWVDPTLSDIDRPLNKRGRKACQLMASPIVEAGCSFDHVFCSVAKRAQRTIEGLNAVLPDKAITWELEKELYTFSGYHLLSWIQELDDSLNDVVIVGHNPAITELSNELGSQTIENVPTCAYVQLTIQIGSWKKISANSAETRAFLYPKMYM